MTTPLPLRCAVSSVLLGACALEVGSSDPAPTDASTDATPVEGDTGTVNLVDTSPGTDVSGMPCGGRRVPMLFAARGTAPGPALVIAPESNLVRDGCAAYYGGMDGTARFVAPRAGRWTFTAVGGDLWSFSARGPCGGVAEQRACAQFLDYHAPSPFTVPLQFTLRLEAEEAVDLVADGCRGGGCSWTLRAQWNEPQGCQDPDRACPTGQRCVTPPGGRPADSTCVTGNAPELLTARALRGGRTLRFLASYRDADDDVSSAMAHLLDAEGRRLPSREVYLRRWESDREGTVQATGQAPERAPQPSSVEFVVTDSLGLRSERRVPIEAAPEVSLGERCDTQGLVDVCVSGAGCALSGVCEQFVAPVLREVLAVRGVEPVRTALRVRWEDPNEDVDALEVTPLGLGREVPFTRSVLEPTARGEPWSQYWLNDAFRGATRLRVRARDRAGLWSEAQEVTITSPMEVALGAPCDLARTWSRCAVGSLCTRYGDPLCREARCRPDVRACPAGVTPEPLAPTRELAGAGSGRTPDGGEPLGTSPCDIFTGARVHSFVAPRTGAYTFQVRTTRADPGPSVLLRRHCALGDESSELGASQTYHGLGVEVSATLQADETVYLFVYTYSTARDYTVSVQGPR